ncbi:MAG: cyclic-di-AMP receptor [Candidatus Borkfalkiaceae bacterium]|nr:cyclic-di-AMP receptor [Christensenellaceae bacterium]
MKMITAIINRKDANLVCDALTNAGFIFTKIATSGGFLKKGNVTLLIGTDIDRVKEVVGIIRDHSAQRTEKTPSVAASGTTSYLTSTDVLVGGATVFVSAVEYFEKM